MKTDKLMIIGHRGAKGLAPENTLAAFKSALKHRVDFIEFDVRVTKDGQAILAHDPFIADPAGNCLVITEHTIDELRRHKHDLCDLESAIRFINKKVPLIVEFKSNIDIKEPVRILRNLLQEGWPASHFTLASFSFPTLQAAHTQLPELPTCVIEVWSGVRATRRARKLGTRNIAMLEYWLWPGFIRAVARGDYNLYAVPPNSPARERHLAKLGLTGHVNNARKAERWRKAGLAGVITDYPDQFVDR